MDHTLALIYRSHHGDEEARERLVKENAGLIWCVVKRFLGRGTEREDLFQIGCMGLLKAIDKFDFSFQVKFSTYAVPMISGEIQRFLRDDGMIKVSRSLRELAYRAYLSKETFLECNGRDPSIEELAKKMQVSKEELIMAMEACGEVESLHRPFFQKDGKAIPLMDRLEGPEGSEDKIINRVALGQLLKSLKGRERMIIYLRYFANKTQSEIGRKLGISQVQVSRMEKKILRYMKEQWEPY